MIKRGELSHPPVGGGLVAKADNKRCCNEMVADGICRSGCSPGPALNRACWLSVSPHAKWKMLQAIIAAAGQSNSRRNRAANQRVNS